MVSTGGMDSPEWPSWLTQDRLAELELIASEPGPCPICGHVMACDCPDAAVGLAVLLAARREANHGSP